MSDQGGGAAGQAPKPSRAFSGPSQASWIAAVTGAAVQRIPEHKRNTLYISRVIKKGKRRGSPRTTKNLNCEGTVVVPGWPGLELPIVCENLALAHAKSGNSVIDLYFQTKDDIESYFQNQPSSHDEWVDLHSNSRFRQVVGNKQFGSFLADVIGQVKQRDLPRCGIVISTSDHVLSCFIQNKPQDDREARVTLDFMDPNDMGRPRRIELAMGDPDPLSGLRRLELAHGFAAWPKYFRKDLPIDASWCSAQLLAEVALPPAVERRYLPPPDQWDLQETVAAALTGNLPDLLYAAGEEMLRRDTSAEQALQWLDPEYPAESPLFQAMQDGFDGVVAAYGTVMQKLGITGEQAADIIEAISPDRRPALCMAVQHGRVGVIKAVGELLATSEVSHERTADILEARRPDGVPALYLAAQGDHAGVIQAVGELLATLKISRERAADIIEARRPDGIPALYVAAQNGAAEVVRVVGGLLTTLGIAQQRVQDILEAKNADGDSALLIAAERGRTDFITEMVRQLEAHDVPKARIRDILQAKAADGCSAIFLAAQFGHASTLEAIVEQLEALEVTGEEMAVILEAKTEDGAPALFVAAQNGHAGAIEAMGKRLGTLSVPTERKLEILEAKDADGVPALNMAAQLGHADAIAAMAGQVAALDIPEERKLQVLQAQTPDGLTAIHMAAALGQGAAILEISKILKDMGVSRDRAAKLIFAMESDDPPLCYAAENGTVGIVRAFAASVDLLSLDPAFALRAIERAGADDVSARRIAVERRDRAFVRALDEVCDTLRQRSLVA